MATATDLQQLSNTKVISDKIPITIIILAFSHRNSVFQEKTIEEIGRLYDAGIPLSVAFEEAHDKPKDDIEDYFASKFLNDPLFEQTVLKVLEYCCSIGPSVELNQILNFYNTCKYKAHVEKKFPSFKTKIMEYVKTNESEIPLMYRALCELRTYSILRYLKTRNISRAGIDINDKSRRKLQQTKENLLQTGQHEKISNLLISHENQRMQEMTKQLTILIKKMPNTGGVILTLELGRYHLDRLGAWMLRESQQNPDLKKYSIQLKLILGKTNRKVLSDKGIDIKVGFDDRILAMSQKIDSEEILALYKKISCQTLLFKKNETGPNFEVECPEFTAIVTEAIARHKQIPIPIVKFSTQTASAGTAPPDTAATTSATASTGSTSKKPAVTTATATAVQPATAATTATSNSAAATKVTPNASAIKPI